MTYQIEATKREPLLRCTLLPVAGHGADHGPTDGGGGAGGGDGRNNNLHATGSRGSWWLWVQAILISLSGLLLGYDLCVIASVLPPVQRDLQLCPACAGPDASDAALAACSCAAKQLAVSACHLGAMVGAACGGLLGDAIGRKPTLLLTDVAFIVAAVAMASAAPNSVRLCLFYAGRALAGAALGAAGAVSSTYLAEISPSAIRGTLVSLNELMLCLGCLLAYVAGTALGDDQWRVTVGLAGLGAGVQLVCAACALTESPRWHARTTRAAVAAEEEEDDEEEEGRRRRRRPSLRELWRDRQPIALALGLALAHGLTGANAVLYYSRDVLQLAGLSSPRLGTLGVGVVKFLGAALALWGVDRIGRRGCLLAGTVAMVVGHAGLAVAFLPRGGGSGGGGSGDASGDGASGGGGGGASGGVMSGDGVNGTLALGSLLLYILAWNLSWAGLMLTLAAELLPQRVRAAGTGLAYALYWLCSFGVSQTLESTFALVGISATFTLYGAATLGALGFAWACVPETRGRGLEAIEAETRGAARRRRGGCVHG